MERYDRQAKRIGVTLLLVLAALLAVTLQAGCTAVNGRPMAGTAAAEQAATATAAEVVHLTFSGTSPGRAADFTKQEVAEWNAANPHIQVTLLEGQATGPDRYGLYLQTFQAQSPAIDIMLIDVTWPGDLAEHLVDFYQYGGTDAVRDDFPAIVQNNTVDGRLVGLPWDTGGSLLYYRTDLLTQYGYNAPPKSWAELQEMAAKIQEGERAAGNQDFWGFVWQGFPYEGVTCDALEWVYSSGGGTIVSPEKIITINNDKAAAALDMAHGWIGTISPPGVTSFMEEESRRIWHAGNAAFMRNWPYAYSLSNAEDSVVKGKFDVAALPGMQEGMSAATLGGWNLAVSKYSKNAAAAVEFAKWLASTEQQKGRAISLSLLPTKASLYADPEVAAVQPFMRKLPEVFVSAVARPSTATAPKYNEVSNIFFTNVSDVLTGRQNGTDAVATIELELQDLLGYVTGTPD